MEHIGLSTIPRILIIEKDPAFADSLSSRINSYFERRSLAIAQDRVEDAAHAFLYFKYYDYDTVLAGTHGAVSDWDSGLLDILRRKEMDIPVIIVSGNGEEKLKGEALSLGAADFFSRDAESLSILPDALDRCIVKYRALKWKERMENDLLLSNRELKHVNDLMAESSAKILKVKKEHERERKKMELLLNAMEDGVVFINGKGIMEMMNPAARGIFCLDEKEMRLDFDDLVVFLGFDPFREKQGEERFSAIFSRDYNVCSTIVEMEDGGEGRMLVFHDVTRDREVERLKAEFQSMISHELRTPLTAIHGAVENFLKGNLGSVSQEQKEFLNMIERNVKRQTELINDMLDLSKLEAQMMDLNVSRVSPEVVAGFSYDSFRYAYDEKGVSLEFHGGKGLPRVTSDDRLLSQVLDNLLSNALKFTPAGGKVRMEVGVSGSGDAAAVFFRVADSGVGVPDGEKEKIFDPYYQVDSREKRPFRGTGLGLAICRKIVALHNGRIWCEDGAEGGAVFTVEIPLSGAGRKKLALLSFDVKNGELDREVLEKEYQVVALDASEDAVEMIAGAMPRLVLLDLDGGAGESFEMLSGLRKNQATSMLPVIFISGTMDADERIKALEAGAADVISRPYNAGELLARVKKAMERQS